MLVWLNGKWLNAEKAFVSVDNRSFRYGDGFFETIKVVNGTVPLWQYHSARLQKSLQQLFFSPAPIAVPDFLLDTLLSLVKKNAHHKLGRVRLTFFRGNGGLYDEVSHTPNVLIQSWPLANANNQLNENGLVVGIYPNGIKGADTLANLKSNNYLLYAMAALHTKQQHWNDAVVLNHHGTIADATIANVWVLKDNLLTTPPLADGPVAGVMRRYLLDAMATGPWHRQEQSLLPQDLQKADAVFLTNGIYGLKWVGEFNGHRLTQVGVVDIYQKFVAPLWRG
jgi:branched-chain amino acid aminotransferase